MPPRPSRLRLLVQDEQILLADAHRRRRVFATVQSKADDVFVEGDRAVEIRDRQMYGTQAERRGQDRRCGFRDSLFVLAHAATPCISAPRWASKTSRSDRG